MKLKVCTVIPVYIPVEITQTHRRHRIPVNNPSPLLKWKLVLLSPLIWLIMLWLQKPKHTHTTSSPLYDERLFAPPSCAGIQKMYRHGYLPKAFPTESDGERRMKRTAAFSAGGDRSSYATKGKRERGREIKRVCSAPVQNRRALKFLQCCIHPLVWFGFTSIVHEIKAMWEWMDMDIDRLGIPSSQ